MRSGRTRAEDLKAMAGLRDLQTRAAEIAAAKAENERRSRYRALTDCWSALDEMQAGWRNAVAGGSFNPELSTHWTAALAAGRDEERNLQAEVDAAEAALRRRRAAWQMASARSNAAREEALSASRSASRKREETLLAAIEDRFAARERRS